MTVRAKFSVTKSSEMGYGGKRTEIYKHVKQEDGSYTYESTGIPVREITMCAVCDDGLSKENRSFAEATPSGNITFQLNNPSLSDHFKPGQTYYIDFIPTDK